MNGGFYLIGLCHVSRERQGHESQQLQELVDGGIEVSLKVPFLRCTYH
jgi:hypothetical protein